MALDKNSLKKQLKEIFEKDDNTAESVAEEIASAIDSYVRSATVTITALTGEIAVVGSPSAQANAQPITLIGNDEIHVGGLS